MKSKGIGSLMHAPIELGPRLYGVLTVAHEDERPLRRRRPRAARPAGPLIGRRDRERHRLRPRAPDRAGAHRRLRARVRCRPSPATRPGSCTSRRPNEPTGGDVYGAWPRARWPRDRRARGRRRRQGSRDRRPERDGALLHRGAHLRLDLAGPRARAGERDARRPAPERHVRDRLPRDPLERLAALLQRGPPAAVARLGPGGRRARGPRPARSASTRCTDIRRACWGSSRATSWWRTATAWSRRAGPGEVYGSERLEQLVRELARTLSPQELVRALHEEVTGWADGLADDMVALALRRLR